MNKTAIALIISTLLTGCTTNPDTGAKSVSNTGKGAGIGAAAGAVVGALTSNKSGRAKGVLTGAAVGAGLGAGAGYYLDNQEEKLRARMQQDASAKDVRIDRTGDSLNVVLPADISFASGEAIVKPSFRPTLDTVADSLIENPNSQITVFGHTDNVGNAGKNEKLGEARAQAVAFYLMGKGVAQSRFRTISVGSANPVADNSTAEGRARNRRVEIRITPAA